MTIYAIVNNLIKEPNTDTNSSAVWTIVSGAGILQGGNPYFVPDFASRFEARLALAARIGKLGKGIAPRFVHRYVESVAPCVLFVADDMLESLRMRGLPWTSAVSYDKCAAFGKFIGLPFDDMDKCHVTLRLESPDSVTETEWTARYMNPGVSDALSSISIDNTLKTGDIILLGVADDGPCVTPGLKARMSLNGEESLKFNIR